MAAAPRPYKTLLNYGLFLQQLNGLPLGNITNTSIPNSKLKPSSASEIGYGAELRMFNSRVGLDIAWYSKKSKMKYSNHLRPILRGYTGVILNIGELQNKGVELLLTSKILSGAELNWTSSFNGSINNNEVISLQQDRLNWLLLHPALALVLLVILLERPPIKVMAFDYKYDASGKVIVGADGIPVNRVI